MYNIPQLPECIYMVTEEATPLETHLQTKEGQSVHSISWGLHQIIVRTLCYILFCTKLGLPWLKVIGLDICKHHSTLVYLISETKKALINQCF